MSKTVYALPLRSYIASVFACALLLLLLLSATNAQAQSTNVDQPTPVISNQVSGQITPRDIGDSRLTRHFYILTGTPGDLVITVESRNLDGDIDLFQAGTLRPLAKVSMYAGELSTRTSKSIYLRQREIIILRVEGRTPNDDKGEYRVSFSGGFEAMAAPAATPETDATAEQSSAPRDKNTRRVSSVGARINEPPPVETATTTQPESSNGSATDSSDTNRPTTTDNTATTTTSPAPVTTARAQRPPSSRVNRRRRGRVTPTSPPETATQNNPDTGADAGEPPPTLSKPTGIESGAKLIIETRDGMRVERFMNTVRRVTVENGQIVVITRDGKITRHPMADVVRMAIEP